MNDLDLGLGRIKVNYCVTFVTECLRNCYEQRLGPKGPLIGNGLRGIKRSRDSVGYAIFNNRRLLLLRLRGSTVGYLASARLLVVISLFFSVNT